MLLTDMFVGGTGIYCFNCTCLTVVLMCGDQYGFVPHADEKIIIESKYLNENGRRDVNLRAAFRLLVLDAPMGAGKTEVAGEYIRSRPSSSILSITFRTALAVYLSNRWGLNSYTDEHFWGDEDKERRSVVCLDSIWRLNKVDAYEYVIIDEATFVQYHFLSGI